MPITIDAGALNNPNSPFGTYTFTQELITACQKFDSKNKYYLYELNKFNKLFFWLKLAIPIQEYLIHNQVFLALNQSLPWSTPAKIIGFSHGLAFKHFPSLYPDSGRKMDQQIETMLKRCQFIIVSSNKVKKDFLKFFRCQKKIIVLPFGLPSPFQKNNPFAQRKKLILAVGLFHPIKRYQLLINSFFQFTHKPNCHNYQLLLIGNNGEFPIEHLIHKSIKNRVKILPPLTQAELLKYYRQASVYVSTSLYESFNFPILEALSQQTPVVATSGAVIPEMKKFVVLAKDDPLDLAEKIYRLTVQSVDLSIQAEKLRKQFSWQKYVNQLIKLYEK